MKADVWSYLETAPARERVELVSHTRSEHETPEELIAVIARVSSSKPPEERKEEYEKLLRYCVEHNHWSIFEMVDVTFKITTSRAIAPQFIRHRSFNFMEYSQRYSKAHKIMLGDTRMQDTTNRQNSLPCDDMELDVWFHSKQQEVYSHAMAVYNEALSKGIAKEVARGLLPLNTMTTFYMKGSLRSWIHYCSVRMKPDTQKEHRDIASVIWEYLLKLFPTICNL